MRAPQKGIHSPLQEPLCSTLFLHQKEGWETVTCTRLQEGKQMDGKKPLPPPPHPGTHQPSKRSRTFHEI